MSKFAVFQRHEPGINQAVAVPMENVDCIFRPKANTMLRVQTKTGEAMWAEGEVEIVEVDKFISKETLDDTANHSDGR